MKASNKKVRKPTIRFNTTVLGSIISLPKNVSAKLPEKNKTTIEGVISGIPFQAAIATNKEGLHQVTLTPTMEKILKKDPSTNITVEITRVGDEQETRIPVELQKALESSPKAHALWKDITPLARRDWIFWIITGKKIETRNIRTEKAISKLSSGMRRVCCFGGIAWLMKTA